ncbi:MAG: PAS domain S-box protein [Melioribacteraceae bacterium]|nr:PAS domain S-box protein [Melioribacteraceae bacterium]
MDRSKNAEDEIERPDFLIYIIEDDQNLAFLINKDLKRNNFEAEIITSGTEALEKIRANIPSLLLLDYRLQDMSGVEIINTLRELNLKIPFIIMTGFGDERIAVEMMKLGAQDYLIKDQHFLEILLPIIEKVKSQIEIGIQLNTAQSDLKKSEIRFKALIENNTDLIGILNNNADLTYYSPSFEKTFTAYLSKPVILDFFQLVHDEDKEHIQDIFNKVREQPGKVHHISFRAVKKNNDIVFLEGTFNNLLRDLNIKGIVANLRNVTAKTLAEDALRKLSRAVEQSSVGIIISDIEGYIEYANPYYTEITGYGLNEIIGSKNELVKSESTPINTYKNLKESIYAGKEWKGEFLNKKKNGELYWESSTITPIYDKNNKITHFLSLKEDITEKKSIQDKIKKANEFYLTLLEDSPTMIWRTNSINERDYFNQTWLKFRGYRIDEEVRDGWKVGIYSEDLEDYLMVVDEAFRNRQSFTVNYRLLRRDGEHRWITEFGKPFFNLDGNFSGFIGSSLDITDIKNAEEAMRDAKESAERSERLKTEFLAQISHEIRTPINAILSFTSLLKFELENQVGDDLKESFKIIDRGGRRLIRTIDLLLHMSEMQTGSYELKKKPLNLDADIIENVILELMNQVQAKKLELNFTKEVDKSLINADENSVIQIFENIIDNAIKYTKQGSVDIRLYKCDNDICVDIKDSGIGISKEFLPHLFTPFTQEETGYTRRFEGNGLGLALVKKYCELNNAEIGVETEKGKGSTFTVKFKVN